jgi:hypothetical protein
MIDLILTIGQAAAAVLIICGAMLSIGTAQNDA